MTKHRTLLLGPLPAVVVLALAGGAVWAVGEKPPAAALIGREQRALDLARGVAKAEEVLRSRATVDRDHDGHGEFGSVADLWDASLIGDLGAHEEEGALVAEGYRITVLLPREAERNGRIAFARDPREVEPTLASRFFAVAAMPLEGRPSGLRAFYVDATSAVWTAEGVCDGERRPFVAPPLRSLIESEETPLEGGIVWRHRAGPPPTERPRPAK